MSKKALLLFMLPVLFLACGEGVFDEEGLAPGQTALEQFTRASQLYYRGRLTASLEEFNGVIYRYPDSPFISDARLAVRRIESELAGELSAQGSSHAMPELDLRIAVIGRPAVSGNVGTASDLLRGTGASITELTDHQAPEITMVFHAGGFQEQASIVADSLDRWLARPETIGARHGEELIEAVASGSDVLVIIGNDAVFNTPVN